MRLDNYLVDQKYLESRTKASRAIKEGRVSVDGQVIFKPSFLIDESSHISIQSLAVDFVSQGGFKLQLAIERLHINFHQKVVLDVGASTGGFTDCALQYEAQKVICVDVGTGQLHPSLRSDPRVFNLEKTDIRKFKPIDNIPDTYDRIIGDVSFISLSVVLPALLPFLKSDGEMILLVKPQFEVGPGNANKRGIVKDPELKKQVLEKIKSTCFQHSLQILGEVSTKTLAHEEKNEEFVLWIGR